MLQPVRSKYRKAHKGRIHGVATRASTINYGSFALKAMAPERIIGKQIEAARVALTRHMKRQGRVWTRIFPNIPVSKKPETNAYLVAENIAQQLVKRISYRRAMKRAMQSCLRLGAKGIKVSISGRLGGNEIARTEWLRDGSIPSHTLRADIDYAEAEALTTFGIIGIKVWIYKGEVFAREFSQETNKIVPKEVKE